MDDRGATQQPAARPGQAVAEGTADQVVDQHQAAAGATHPLQKIHRLLLIEMVQKQAAEDHVVVLGEGIVEGIGLEEAGAQSPLLGAAGRDGHRLRAEVAAVNLHVETFPSSPFRQGGGVVPTAAGQIQNPQRLAAVLAGQGTDRREQGTHGSAEGIDPAQTLQGLAVGERIDAGLVHPLGLPVPLGQGRKKHHRDGSGIKRKSGGLACCCGSLWHSSFCHSSCCRCGPLPLRASAAAAVVVAKEGAEQV